MKHPLSIAEAIDDLIEARLRIQQQTTEEGRDFSEHHVAECKALLVETLAENDDDN